MPRGPEPYTESILSLRYEAAPHEDPANPLCECHLIGILTRGNDLDVAVSLFWSQCGPPPKRFPPPKFGDMFSRTDHVRTAEVRVSRGAETAGANCGAKASGALAAIVGILLMYRTKKNNRKIRPAKIERRFGLHSSSHRTLKNSFSFSSLAPKSEL